MRSVSPCNDIQERLVADGALDDEQKSHVLTCSRCSRMAAAHATMVAAFCDALQAAVEIPEDFADRVMAQLEEDAPSPARRRDLLGRPWVQIALAHVGLAVAVANVVRFVLASLLPSTSLGGVR
jgi:anti-sigma factor RsiW